MIYRAFLLKRIIENLIIRPFVWLGRRSLHHSLPREDFRFILFFPFYHTGGAEKVHLQIAAALRGKKTLIVFTRKSLDQRFFDAFKESGHTLLDISSDTDNKYAYWKNLYWRGVMSGYINTMHSEPIVLNGQSNFAYKLSPWLRKDLIQIELIHSFNSFSHIRIPFLPFYRQTVMISRKAIRDHLDQYKKIGVPEKYAHNVRYICNGILISNDAAEQEKSISALNVLYAGRATAEKRVWIAAEIALACNNRGLPVSFHFAGDIRDQLPEQYRDAGVFHGNLNSQKELDALYRKADILLLTSSEEGFPMVIMEAMAEGCIILATPVGDIPYHLGHPGMGYLFSDPNEPEKIVTEAIGFISTLLEHPENRLNMSEASRSYAREHFDLRIFERNWLSLFTDLQKGQES